jgi:hypothetical protein
VCRLRATFHRQQQQAIGHALGIRKLMDRQDQCAAVGGYSAQHVHNFAGLPDVETVERLIHE